MNRKGASVSIETRTKLSKSLKGRVITEEARKKLSIALTGRKLSKEHKKNMSIAARKRKSLVSNLGEYLTGKPQSGEGNWNWKGGVSSENRLERIKFRQTIQKKVFERDDYTCQICGERGGNIQVDHIQAWSEYVGGRFDVDNCRTLCMGCHYFITFGKPLPSNVGSWGHNFLMKGNYNDSSTK